MKCCICDQEIEVKRDPKGKIYWTEGNNAEPVVKEGRCCDACNTEVVIPVRMGGDPIDYIEARLNRVRGTGKCLDSNLRSSRN